MNNKKIAALGLIVLVAIGVTFGLTQISNAATLNSGSSNTSGNLKEGMHKSGVGNMINQANRLKRKVAVDAAMASGDYNAWVAAEGKSSSILAKINANNFPKLVQAYELRKQEETIMKDLGIKQGAKFEIVGSL
ncbi:MAG: hypothetical protein WCN88_01970 [Candidatus Falkowbacteria bacterium]